MSIFDRPSSVVHLWPSNFGRPRCEPSTFGRPISTVKFRSSEILTVRTSAIGSFWDTRRSNFLVATFWHKLFDLLSTIFVAENDSNPAQKIWHKIDNFSKCNVWQAHLLVWRISLLNHYKWLWKPKIIILQSSFSELSDFWQIFGALWQLFRDFWQFFGEFLQFYQQFWQLTRFLTCELYIPGNYRLYILEDIYGRLFLLMI